MSFATAINCMDGRVQLPVIEYLRRRFRVKYVDMITEPGPNLILAKQTTSRQFEAIFRRLHISIEKHASAGIAVVGHHDCAGNPVSEAQQRLQLAMAVGTVKRKVRDLEVIGLWVAGSGTVEEIDPGTVS